MRFYGYKRRKRFSVFLIAAVIICFTFTSIHILKIINSLALSAAVQRTTEIMNTCALEHIEKAGDIYNAMLIKEKNSSGTVSAINTDIQKINLLQTDIAEIITEELKKNKRISFNLSFANIIGYTLICDRGLKIPIEFSPISTVETSFKEDFVSAGINQTMLTVNLEISTDMRIGTFPLNSSKKVTHTIPVAKIVIVGETPNGIFHSQLK